MSLFFSTKVQGVPLTVELKTDAKMRPDLRTALIEGTVRAVERLILPVVIDKIGRDSASEALVSIQAITQCLSPPDVGCEAETLVTLMRRDMYLSELALAVFSCTNDEAIRGKVEYPYTPQSPTTNSP